MRAFVTILLAYFGFYKKHAVLRDRRWPEQPEGGFYGKDIAVKLLRYVDAATGRVRLGVLTLPGVLDALEAVQALPGVTAEQKAALDTGSPLALFAGEGEVFALLRRAVEAALAAPGEGALFRNYSDLALLAPVPRPPRIICIGLNYRDHALETGAAIPESPVVFAKFPMAAAGPGEAIVHPAITEKLDYEAELAVVIGRGGRRIAREAALEHVAGYMNLNDVSARDLQARDGQWIRAKSCDTFAPMGPLLVTRDEVADPQNLRVSCRVNGRVLQDSNTREMIFPVDRLISFLSEFTTLEPGDVIATGTPPGVGVARKPPAFLKPGDVVEVEVEGLGVLRNPVTAERD